VFIAATQDYFLRAYETGTGTEVWKARLPVGSQGTPINHKSPVTGQQFVLISAGGARNSPDRGDHVIAYALPKQGLRRVSATMPRIAAHPKPRALAPGLFCWPAAAAALAAQPSAMLPSAESSVVSIHRFGHI
jgi:hypothetical protein